MVGRLEIIRRNAHALECSSEGDVTVDDVATTRAQLAALLHGSSREANLFLIMKTHRATGFAPEVREPVRALLMAMHAAGMEVLISVAASPLTRMTGTSMAMSVGVVVKHADTDADVDGLIAHELQERAQRHRH